MMKNETFNLFFNGIIPLKNFNKNYINSYPSKTLKALLIYKSISDSDI